MKRTHPGRGRPPIDDDDPSEQICLKLPGKQFDALDREAKNARVSVQDLIRRAVHARSVEKRYPK